MSAPTKGWAAVILVAAAVLVSGCGSSRAMNRGQFLTEANRICTHFSGLQNQVQFPSTNPVAAGTSHAARAEWGVALKQVAYLGTQETKALRRLDPPDELARQFASLLSVEDRAYATLLRSAEAAKQNDPALVRTTGESGRAILARATALAKTLGLPRCG